MLTDLDEADGQVSGPTTKEVLRQHYEVHGDPAFEWLASIFNCHIYNVRKTRTYRVGPAQLRRFTPVGIGQRRKPTRDGRPGHLHVDTVHLGDRHEKKGIYVIDLVDEVAQSQYLGAVVRVAEFYFVPLLTSVPFTIEAFHADNGSEYVIHRVVKLLTKLHVGSLAESRPRQSNNTPPGRSRNNCYAKLYHCQVM